MGILGADEDCVSPAPTYQIYVASSMVLVTTGRKIIVGRKVLCVTILGIHPVKTTFYETRNACHLSQGSFKKRDKLDFDVYSPLFNQSQLRERITYFSSFLP
jgi:hypothetical protein